jgi:hypothetical protein
VEGLVAQHYPALRDLRTSIMTFGGDRQSTSCAVRNIAFSSAVKKSR